MWLYLNIKLNTGARKSLVILLHIQSEPCRRFDWLTDHSFHPLHTTNSQDGRRIFSPPLSTNPKCQWRFFAPRYITNSQRERRRRARRNSQLRRRIQPPRRYERRWRCIPSFFQSSWCFCRRPRGCLGAECAKQSGGRAPIRETVTRTLTLQKETIDLVSWVRCNKFPFSPSVYTFPPLTILSLQHLLITDGGILDLLHLNSTKNKIRVSNTLLDLLHRSLISRLPPTIPIIVQQVPLPATAEKTVQVKQIESHDEVSAPNVSELRSAVHSSKSNVRS